LKTDIAGNDKPEDDNLDNNNDLGAGALEPKGNNKVEVIRII